MTDQDKTQHPLDHATARIITELAAALTAPLQETVSRELAKTIKSLPVDIDREAEEVLSSLRRLKALAEEMANALSSAQNTVSALSGELLPMSRACEAISEAAARLERIRDEPRGEPRSDSDAPQTDALLRSLEAVLSDLKTGFADWKGVLKANGRAQTQELSEFSAEVSEQVGWMKSAMPGILMEEMEKMEKMSKENISALETRLTKFEKTGKMLLIALGVFLTLLGVLYFK